MQMTRRALLGLTFAPAAALVPVAARAGTPPVHAVGGIALGGTDPVAYFDGDGPVPGVPDFAHDWNGARWHFATPENRAAFAADPEHWAPAYGGWCAYAVSRGYTAPTDPRAWSLHEGRLFLN